MAEPARAPGWYPDPWNQEGERWHDGRSWSAEVRGTSSRPAVIAPPAMPQLPRQSGRATSAMVTSLIGIPVVPIVLGLLARRDIARSGGTLTGAGAATTGIVLGVLNLVVLAALALVVLPWAMSLVGDVRSDLGSAGLPTSPTEVLAVARGAQAQATLRQLTVGMETCAATNGSYTGCEREAARSAPQVQALLAACGSPGGACIQVTAPDSYTISIQDQSSPPTTWTEQHSIGGAVTRSCDGPACASAEAFS